TGVNALLFFREVEVYNAASLRPMLDFLPWLLLFLVPAVTMRALAEDLRSGTLEVVLSQPVTELELLLVKYCGQVLFLLLHLAITLTVPQYLPRDRKSTRLNSSHRTISYAVFCL